MVSEKLLHLERELDKSYNENLSINTHESNPHLKEILSMVGNRALDIFLRKGLNLN